MKARISLLDWIGSFVAKQSDSLWILAERVVSNALNFLAIIAIMRVLGPTAYGEWAFASSILTLMLVAGHLGLDGLLVRKLVEQPDNAPRLLGVTVALKYAILVPVVAATLAFFSLKAAISANELTLLRVLMAVILIAPLTSALVAWSNARSQFGPVARGRIAAIFMGFAAKVTLILGGFGVISVGLAHSAMFALEAAVLLVVVAMRGGPMPWAWRFDRKTVSELLGQSLYLFAATVFATLYLSLDILVLRVFRGSFEVGLYALVPQIILASQLVPYALTLSRFPALTRAVSNADQGAQFIRAVGETLRTLVTLSILAICGLALFIVIAFDWVFGPSYEPTKQVLWIACLALPPIFVRQLTTKIFIIIDQGGRLAAIEFGGLVTVLAIMLAAVPEYGAPAAISAVVVGCWLTVLLSLLFSIEGRSVWRRTG